MAEYIKREDALDALSKSGVTCNMRAHKIVAELPADDVAEVRRHGKWIEKETLNRRTGIAWKERRCSECGYYNHKPNFPKNYCPKCGCRMDKEDEHGTD